MLRITFDRGRNQYRITHYTAIVSSSNHYTVQTDAQADTIETTITKHATTAVT
jgi:hypothetical protein